MQSPKIFPFPEDRAILASQKFPTWPDFRNKESLPNLKHHLTGYWRLTLCFKINLWAALFMCLRQCKLLISSSIMTAWYSLQNLLQSDCRKLRWGTLRRFQKCVCLCVYVCVSWWGEESPKQGWGSGIQRNYEGCGPERKKWGKQEVERCLNWFGRPRKPSGFHINTSLVGYFYILFTKRKI